MKQLSLWKDEKQRILEEEKVDLSTLKTLKTRKYPFSMLPKNTYFIYKSGGVNPHMKEKGPIFPVIKNARGKPLSPSPLSSGKDAPYPHVHICRTVATPKDGPPCMNKMKKINLKCYIHKIVGLAFISNPDYENKYILDHLDGNIYNYLPTNLEWVTPSENNLRRYAQKREDQA